MQRVESEEERIVESRRSAVTVIPQKKSDADLKIPVAVYCRVSTKSENQRYSLENQIEHYRSTVGADPRYELVEIYYDFGISGYKESRPGFQKMMEDAEEGRFQLLITKAITRFARNTQTVLDSTRRLKELGIGVYFELQGINTLSQAGELLMTLYAAFGQAESEGARMHTLMVLRRKYEEGNPPRQLQRCLGYRKGPDGEFYPDERAALVLEMFEMAADGYTAAEITNYLNGKGLTTQNGKAFHRASVTWLLRNPVYKGDFIAQGFYVDEERKLKKNKGEKPMYYIEEDHIPIVTNELWDRAQEALDAVTRKKPETVSKARPLNDENYPYRSLLYCFSCGHRLMRQVRKSKADGTFRVLWECNGKERFSKEFCSGVSVTDDEIQTWLPLTSPQYIFPIREKGKIIGHGHMAEEEWSKNHTKKKHTISAPELNETNYPYMNHIFCKSCGSRLRRIKSNAGKVFWICSGQSRKGTEYCTGIRVPDEKLKSLGHLSFDVFVGRNDEGELGYAKHKDNQ